VINIWQNVFIRRLLNFVKKEQMPLNKKLRYDDKEGFQECELIFKKVLEKYNKLWLY
jgi:hypothetical protein